MKHWPWGVAMGLSTAIAFGVTGVTPVWGEAIPAYRQIAQSPEDMATALLLVLEAQNALESGEDSEAEIEAALAKLAQAIPGLEAIGAPTLNLQVIAHYLSGVGHRRLRANPQALASYQRALQLSEHLTPEAAQELRGKVLNGIGLVYSEQGEITTALQFLEPALEHHRAISDRPEEAATLTNLGAVYAQLGEHRQALTLYQQALRIYQSLDDPLGQGNLLNNIGLVYHHLGEQRQALDSWQQALNVGRSLGNRRLEAASVSNLALIADGEQRRAGLGEALSHYQALGDRLYQGHILNNIGAFYAEQGNFPQALNHYQQALERLRGVGDRQGEAMSLANIASVQQRQGELTTALATIEQAIALIEELRGAIAHPNLRQTYFSRQQDYYQFYTDLLMQLHQQNPGQGYDVRAFHGSERSRARSLIDLIAEAQLDLRSSNQPALQPLLAQEREILAAIRSAEQQLIQRLNLGNSPNQGGQTRIRQEFAIEIRQLNQQLDNVVAQIRRQNPAHSDLQYPEPLTLQQIQQQVLDEDTVLLQYSLHPGQSYLWLVSKTGHQTYILPPQGEIEANARLFYNNIISSRCSRAANAAACLHRTLNSPGSALYEQLLGPVGHALAGKRLLIVPDGVLHYIPFAALPLPSDASEETYRPLIMGHEMLHAPSGTAIASQRRRLAQRPPAPKDLAILADPVFSSDDPRITGRSETPTPPENTAISLSALLSRAALDRSLCIPGDGLAPLPGTRQEAQTLINLVPGDSVRSAFDFDANQDWFNSTALGDYRTLWLATHGCIDSQNPELSGLVLSLFDRNGQPQSESFLRLNQIFNLQLNADLVVLSACQTGLGEDIKGEGMVGMTRGFMYAGAKQVVVSLWDVNDQTTAELMGEFYATMQEGKPAAEALRTAKLSLWERYQDPRLWAAFILQGDWQ